MKKSSTQFSTMSPITVSAGTSGVKCNGGNGVLGHPEVYYSFDGKPEVSCIYCGQAFIKSTH